MHDLWIMPIEGAACMRLHFHRAFVDSASREVVEGGTTGDTRRMEEWKATLQFQEAFPSPPLIR